MRKGNEGFTLVELMAGIVCVTLVMGAAMSMMLMGQRTNRVLSDAVSEQQTARIITTLLENLASEDSISRVEFVMTNEIKQSGWRLIGKDNKAILSYSDGKIVTHDNTVLMDGITASSLELSSPEETISGRLLQFNITTNENTYNSTVFCRLGTSSLLDTSGDSEDEDIAIRDFGDGTEEEVNVGYESSGESISGENVISRGRFQLLQVLCSQFGSTGYIIYPTTGDGSYRPEYYSEAYIGKETFNVATDWNANTPWCGCFLSWGAAEVERLTADVVFNTIPHFANVDTGKANFAALGSNHWKPTRDENGVLIKDAEGKLVTPLPGDFIFFSWDDDKSTLEHVGAVFAYENGYVYTIEGNSGGKVALNRYRADDPSIVGYGVLDWKTS